jgi:hypothetical protein
MIRIKCTVQDFLTERAISGCTVNVRVLVAPTLFGPVPDLSAAEGFGRQAVTEADGILHFEVDVSDAFRRLERLNQDGTIAGNPVALVEFSTTCDRLQRTRALEKNFGENDTIETVLALDFAKSIVGHTTANSARVWFCLHANRQEGDPYFCEVDTVATAAGPIPLQRHRIVFDGRAKTKVLEVTGLEEDTIYRYVLRYQKGSGVGQPRQGRELTAGEFRTFSEERDRDFLSFAFGSCHLPVHHTALSAGVDAVAREALERWTALSGMSRSRFDMLILMGDQIYADGIKRNFPDDSWFTKFVKRYHQLLEYRDMRKVLASRSTYMILDDHDIADDFGTKKLSQTIVSNGLAAYREFQHALNPGGPGGPFHYHFRRGPAAFFVLDTRTRRTADAEGSEFPVLGRPQLEDVRSWARSEEVLTADVIVLVTSVPLAWLPIETVRKAAEDVLEETVGLLGAIVGTLFGAGPVIHGGIGYLAGNIVAGKIFESKLNDPDLEDQWTFGPNQHELRLILTLLFDLANDLDPSTGEQRPARRRRAVFVLSGDVHMGAVHVIRSNQDGKNGTRNHRANPVIYALTSSPISHPPDTSEAYERVIEHVGDDLNANLNHVFGALTIDLSKRGLSQFFDKDQFLSAVGNERAKFVLDTEGDGLYGAELVGLVPKQRNYGLFSLRRLSGTERRYQFAFSIEGPNGTVGDEFILNLSATTVVPQVPLELRLIARRCLKKSGALSARRDIFALSGVPAGGSVRRALDFIIRTICKE